MVDTPETPAEIRARLQAEAIRKSREDLARRAAGNPYRPTPADVDMAALQAEATARARTPPPQEQRGVPMPLAARIVLNPERTTYGKMWETDLDAIELKPFNDRPWLTRASAVIAKFRPRDLLGEIGAASLKVLSITMARLWYEGKGVCHHSWWYICERSGLCRDTVRRGLKWLRLHGLLVGMNVLVRPEGGTEARSGEERVANVYLPKLPEEGPPELALPVPESPAAKANVIERVKAELSYIARFCRDAIVTPWGINIRRAPVRSRGHPAPS